MQLLTREDVETLLGVSPNKLRDIRTVDPTFPPPVRLPGGRLLRWDADDLAAWLDTRKSA